ENLYPIIFEPAEQFRLNCKGRLALTKVVKLHCEVKNHAIQLIQLQKDP
ncbi:9360_t:CDS:1, partial [Funneliformis geosporum]